MSEEQKRNHARVLNVNRRHLNKEQRNEVMRAMRADGAGYQEIAQAVGVSIGTVHSVASDVELFNSEKLPVPPSPAVKPSPTIPAILPL